MLQSIKKLTKHTIVYGIGHIIGRMVGFLLLPIHSSILEPAEYGIASLLFSSLAMLNVVFIYGMDIAFLRFFIIEKSEAKKREIFSTSFFMILFTGIIFSAIILLNRPFISNLIFRSEGFEHLILIAVGILMADVLALIPFMALRATEKSGTFVTIRMINVLANVGLNILFVVFMKMGVPGIFYANLIASLVTLLALLPVTFRWIKPVFKVATLKSLIFFGLPYVPSGLALLIMEQIGRFYLDRMINISAAGLFSAAYKLGMFMALLVAAFRFAWQPFFLSMTEDKDAPRVFSRILTYFMTVAGFIFLVIAFFLQEIIHIHIGHMYLIEPEYHAGVSIVPFVLLGYIGYGAYVNFVVGVYFKKKTVLLPVVTACSALVSVIANSFLIPRFGLNGAAIAIMLSYWTMGILMYLINQKLYPVSYEWMRLGKVVLAAGILFVLRILVPGFELLIVRILLVLCFPLLLWSLHFFNQDEKKSIARFLHH